MTMVGKLLVPVSCLILFILSLPTQTESAATKLELPEIYRCGQYYKKCEKCVKAGCLYCYTDRKCKSWTRGLLPPPAKCALGDARWSVCWLNFKTLIIAGFMIFAMALVAGSIAVYCLCCRGASKKAKLRYNKDEEKWEKDREQRRLKAGERKKEREAKAKEIRTKYGINENGYDRFR